MKLSVQTFTIRKHLRTAKEIDKSFRTLSALGVEAVELARIKFSRKEIDAVKAASKKYKVEIGSTQIRFSYLLKNFDWVVQFHKELNCKYACVSVLPDKYKRGNANRLLEFAGELNKLGERYKREGINLLYHHHHYEFRKYNDLTGFEILTGALDKDRLGLVLDTYWLQRGGKSPQEYIEKFSSRVKIVHFRDYQIKWNSFDLFPCDTELGNGNLDFERIKEACIKSGVEYAAIEQDSQTPFKSLEYSIKHYHSI